ncbi:hypothetical protein ACJZ2D_014670 [Fusarium nematophilum]
MTMSWSGQAWATLLATACTFDQARFGVRSLALHAFEGQIANQFGVMYGRHVLLHEKYQAFKSIKAGHHLMASAREFQIINGDSALLEMPVLGGRERSSSHLGEGVAFTFQHDAQFVSRSADGTVETVPLFDNATHIGGLSNSAPSGKIVQIDHRGGTASLVSKYVTSGGLISASQRNAQVLLSGNVFMGWGQGGAVSEFNALGEVLFYARLDSAPWGVNVET